MRIQHVFAAVIVEPYKIEQSESVEHSTKEETLFGVEGSILGAFTNFGPIWVFN